ncbi:MAG: shikimate dehydrogenase [Pseudomonadota bacterium]
MRDAAATARRLRAARSADLRLALIGDHIGPSRAPELHRIAGRQAGLCVAYDLLIPPALELTFRETLDTARAAGLAGVNVTAPYKERAFEAAAPGDAAVARIGAANTVLFTPSGPVCRNTDHSGFLAAWRARFGDRRPGRAALLGAGGVGRAVAFALAALDAELRIFDEDAARATRLAGELREAGGAAEAAGLAAALDGADGILNCTPLGMAGVPGAPVPAGAFPPAAWAFDAVYTPEDTPFSAMAVAAGADLLPGWELFFHQGVDAFALFAGEPVRDQAALRRALRG